MQRGAAVLALLLAVAPPLAAEWELSGYLGGAHTLDASLRVRQPARPLDARFHDLPFAGRSFEPPLYYGYRAGYFFQRHFGLEAEFIHAKTYAEVERSLLVEGVLGAQRLEGELPVNAIVSRFSISHGLNLLTGNLAVRQDFARRPGEKLGRLLVTGRFGVGGTIPHVETTVLGQADEHYQAGSPVIQFAGGAELRLWRGLYGLAEYKFTRTNQHLRIAGGTAETLLATHHGVFGLAYHF